MPLDPRIKKYLGQIPEGEDPYVTYKARQNALSRLFDRVDLQDANKRSELVQEYIGPEPADVDRKDSASGWWDRTVSLAGYNSAAMVSQVRMLVNDALKDDRDFESAYQDATDWQYKAQNVTVLQETLKRSCLMPPILLGVWLLVLALEQQLQQ